MGNLNQVQGLYAETLYQRGFDRSWRRKQEGIAGPVFELVTRLSSIAPKVIHLGASQAPLLLDFISRHFLVLRAVAADRPEEIPAVEALVRTPSPGFLLEAFEKELPYANEEFDFGILTAGKVDDPLPDWIDPLREVCRTTKIGGLVLVTRLITPNVTLLDETILGLEGVVVRWGTTKQTEEGERLFLGGLKSVRVPDIDNGR